MGRAWTAVFLWMASALAGVVWAEPVTADMAGRAVSGWLGGGRQLGRTVGGAVASTRTLAATNGAAFHVVRLARGFVVTSGDTRLEPVVAYCSGPDLVEDEANPLWALVSRDMALRAAAAGVVGSRPALRSASAGVRTDAERKWAELLGGGGAALRAANPPREAVADVRVEPLVRSKWGQSSVGGRDVYNYYTPDGCVCGCVATAGAQIMRYHEWPKAGMPQFTCGYCELYGERISLTTCGGAYDWASMPLEPTSSISERQRQAIGRLTSDLGICCGMSYTGGSSGAGGYMLASAFTEHFGYSNAIAWMTASGRSEDVRNAMVSNLDAGYPVAVSISGDGGHEIVGDGYGYSDGTLYYHFNLGWGGYEDAWYAPPDLAAGGYSFSALDGLTYNIFPTGPKGAVIASGRVLTPAGVPVAGATVTARRDGAAVETRTTNDRGIYAFVLPEGSYSVVAEKHGCSRARTVELSACVPLTVFSSGFLFGRYLPIPLPTVGNRCDQDIELEDETPVTAEVPIPVKYEWLSARFPSASASDYLRIAGSAGANGRPVWQSYLLGLDPTSAGSDFRITSFALVDGKPVVGSNVDAARIGSMGYECRVRGAEVPSSGAWSDVTPAHRYFKLVVVPKSSP